MGRKKLQMKRIADKNRRLVTFSKRRSGLIKRARDLSVLCDVQVAAVVFSGRGKLYDFSSGTNCSVATILQRYQSHCETEGRVAPVVCEPEKLHASFQTSRELLEIAERYLDGPNAEEVSVTDLIQLEEQLDAALIQTRSRKTQLMMENILTFHEKERNLRDENELLKQEIAKMEEDDKRNYLANYSPQIATLSLLPGL